MRRVEFAGVRVAEVSNAYAPATKLKLLVRAHYMSGSMNFEGFDDGRKRGGRASGMVRDT